MNHPIDTLKQQIEDNLKSMNHGLPPFKAVSEQSESPALSISQIETEFDKNFDLIKILPAYFISDIKQFYRSKIIELLESTRLEKQDTEDFPCDCMDGTE